MNRAMSMKHSLLLLGALFPIALTGSFTISAVLCGALLAYMRFTGRTYVFITDCIAIFVFSLAVFGFNFLSAAITVASIIILANTVHAAMRGRASLSAVITVGGGAMLLLNVCIFGMAAREAGVTPLDMMFRLPLEESISIMKSNEGIDQSVVLSISKQAEELIKTFEMVAPSVLIITALITAYASFTLARTAIEKKGTKLSHLPYFSELRMPAGLTAVFLALFVFTLFGGTASAITVNIITVIMAVLAVCGLSVLDFYFKSFAKLATVFRFLIYFVIFMFISLTGAGMYSVSVLFAAGAIDSFVPLRREKNSEMPL